MTNQVAAKISVEEANEYPSLSNFDLLYITNKFDVLSDTLANACFEVRPEGVNYSKYSDTEKQRVKVLFFDALNTHNITLTLDIIEFTEHRGCTNMATLLRQYGYNVPFESVFTEAVEALQPQTKVTIVKFTDFGFPVAIQTVIDHVEVKPYAQYKESLKIVHKPKRKRSLYSNTILPYENFIVYDGWINVDIDSITKTVIKETPSMTVTQGNYACFNDNYLTDILSAVPETPITTFNIKSAVTA
ncbi:hypothetical protein SAMN04487895_101716 [Paenibacillus sophorae]|uniref:Uncharacterized protein n=1 Tax=Paenibacillus sophorae TaxID=1333845 RepID=A0A1H8H291_9BACL|nr:hypothetical protein [Paenibacillus sophorae]QWU14406.1 hypothetical protein KP014_21090 [Paenibacillus sophorae]SEN49827.1 hypothetical protein SAMN04487895_101716 [Paenibacillus sophorae]